MLPRLLRPTMPRHSKRDFVAARYDDDQESQGTPTGKEETKNDDDDNM